MNVDLVTCTGDRPLAFSLCAKYVKRQFFPIGVDCRWVVADDGKVPLDAGLLQGFDAVLLRGRPTDDKVRSFAANMTMALKACEGDVVLFIEDDEWYGPGYVSGMVSGLGDAELVGEQRAVYYNVRERTWRRWANMDRASLCQTGIRARLKKPVLSIIKQSQNAMVDRVLWGMQFKGSMLRPFGQCVGIKGMPGRSGIGVGHRARRPGRKHDREGLVLKQLVGVDDAVPYLAQYEIGGKRG